KDGECYDDILIDSLKQYLATIAKDDDRPRLIVLHQVGSHGPAYYKRAPEAYQPFKPTCDTNAIQGCSQTELLNSYDNTIVYTDHVLSQMINTLKEISSAGHYVKMVHNGIEYADMQLIAESYAMMKELLGMSHEDIAQTFKDWNAGELESYLIEITGDIFMKLDENKEALVEKILDTAGQKGTGKWTSINALELG
ncbi:sulfatase-like hydrolase/transferase, partial [Acinetobacter baumannii]